MQTANSKQQTANSHNYPHQFPHEITRIEINDQIFEYEDESKYITYQSIWPINEPDARELLHAVKTLFDKAGIKFALAFGTLLGAVRDKGLIKGDEDMDIFVCDEQKLRDNFIFFRDNGLKVCRAVPKIYYSFRINHTCYIDVYIMSEITGWKRFIWGWYCVSLCGLETPRKLFTGYQEIEFLGEKCMCPRNPERLLEFWYGPDWRTPVQGHKFVCRVKSAVFYYKYISPVLSPLSKIFKFIFSSRHRQHTSLDKPKS